MENNLALAAPLSSRNRWIGRALGGLACAFLLLDAAIKVLQLGPAVQGTARVGYPTSAVLPIGVVELVCVVLFLVPRTAVLGAALLTAYLGGAVATHVRLGEPFWMPVVFGVVLWTSLYLRDGRLRALLAAPAAADPE